MAPPSIPAGAWEDRHRVRHGAGARVEFQAERLASGAERRGEAAVAGEDVGDALLVDHLERLAQAPDQRHRRGEGGLVLLRVRLRAAEIPEEAAAAVVALHHRPGLFRHRGEAEAGRAHQRLLRGGDEHVDAPLVLPDLDPAEG